jgi:hypothetical protein
LPQTLIGLEPRAQGFCNPAPRPLFEVRCERAAGLGQALSKLGELLLPSELIEPRDRLECGVSHRALLGGVSHLGPSRRDARICCDGGGLTEQCAGSLQAVAEERDQVVGAVEVFGQVLEELLERRAGRVLVTGAADAGARRAEQVDGEDAQAAVLGGLLQGGGHRQALERLHYARRVALLQAGHQTPTRLQVLLGRVDVDDQEDPAEQ